MHLSRADHSTSPPIVDIPRDYNAAHDLLSRNAARSGKVAYIDAASGATLTYGELDEQAHRFANALRARGFEPETRMLIAMLDTLEWPVVFLGCILAGVVPIAANTLLTTKDFEFMLRDSRAQALFVSKPLLPTIEPLIGSVRTLKTLVIAGDTRRQLRRGLDRSRASGAAERGLHLLRRSLLLALFQRLDRHAQGHGAPAQPSDPDGGAVRPRHPRHPRGRRRLFRGQAVLRLRAGQRTHVPDERRRHRRPAARAADAGRRVRGAEESTSRRSSTACRRCTARCWPIRHGRNARGAEPARVHQRRRGAAGRHRQALDRAIRLRDPRRHRLDRDAAHLPVQPPGRGALRHHRQGGAGL